MAGVALATVAWAFIVIASALPSMAQSPCDPKDFVCKGSQAQPQQQQQQEQPPQNQAVSADGYIWLGNLRPDGTIASSTVRLEDGKPVGKFDQFSPGMTLVAVNSVYMRENLPKNNTEYFHGERVVGIFEVGQKATLQVTPVAIQRSPALVQLWAQVRRAN
jgi:hypothetical protein